MIWKFLNNHKYIFSNEIFFTMLWHKNPTSYMLHIANNSFKWHILFPRQVIFWPLIPQTLGHFTPYYIKTSDQTKISQRENSLQPKTHTASQKVGSDNFSQEGGYDWDRWQLGSAKTDLDSNSQRFILVLSPPSQATGPSHCSPLSYHQF